MCNRRLTWEIPTSGNAGVINYQRVRDGRHMIGSVVRFVTSACWASILLLVSYPGSLKSYKAVNPTLSDTPVPMGAGILNHVPLALHVSSTNK